MNNVIKQAHALISVIIPAYNAEKTLIRAVKSVIAQTYSLWQLIIVDDGSNDSTFSLCEKIENTIPEMTSNIEAKKIKIIHTDNQGTDAARMTGVKAADGEYVMFLDADDELTRDAMMTLLSVATDHKSEITCAESDLSWEDGTHFNNNSNLKEASMERQEAIRFLLNKRWAHHAKLYRKKLFINMKADNDYRYGEDLYRNWKLFNTAMTFSFTPVVVYHFFKNNESMTHKKFNYAMLSGLDVI